MENHVSPASEDDYGCDICGDRIPYGDVVWLTSSCGVCEKCYEKLMPEQREEMYRTYE